METRNEIDHATFIRTKVATQYRESANLLGYVDALDSEHQPLEVVYNDLLERLDLDKAQGALQDIIGRIVGQPREVIDVSNVQFFSFAGVVTNNIGGFADAATPQLGGRLLGEGESLTGNKRLSDSEYSLFIRARIFKNHSLSTPEETIAAFKFIFQEVGNVVLSDADPQSGSARITFTRELSLSEKGILNNTDLRPKTLGVNYEYAEVIALPYFGFSGFPDSQGFGDATTPTLTGGTLPSQI